ncbi:MAG: polysaccharide deacetylase family protein [Burkholderiales bacterium]|nr:polysaccharide deacetylase family protein [Burkholderiales bacterium]
MDHPHHAYRALAHATPVAWPRGARLAFWVLLHVEHWELLPPADAHRDPRFLGDYGSFSPDFGTWGQREYGNRVGVFRVLDALDRHGIRATVALGSAAAARCPQVVRECRARGYEFIGHGSHANRMLTGRMDEDQERAFIGAALDAVQDAAGLRPRGWHGQDFGESARTPRLLAEAGLDYVADWPNDDAPYPMRHGRPLISLPLQPEWDDVQAMWLRRLPMERYAQLVASACTTLRGEGGRVFCLSLHPWMIGQAHRIGQLRLALEHICGLPDVWQATAGEIVDAYRDA